MQKMAWLLKFETGEMPFKYLGVSMGSNHRKLSIWQTLIESLRITCKTGRFVGYPLVTKLTN